eukprot:m.344068 g.344068  ORF g.344068 m.344068 type:complete len:119 (+) comp16133_c0_seq16:1804-2160(+)
MLQCLQQATVTMDGVVLSGHDARHFLDVARDSHLGSRLTHVLAIGGSSKRIVVNRANFSSKDFYPATKDLWTLATELCSIQSQVRASFFARTAIQQIGGQLFYPAPFVSVAINAATVS